MFKYERPNDGPAVILADGSIMEIAAEITYMIHRIHSAISEQDPGQAATFRFAITHGLTRPDSPTWKKAKMTDGDISMCYSVQKKPGAEG